MKNLLTACLPALALLALGGCAGTSALTSSEDDGVYYSSKDRTTVVANTAPSSGYAATNEAANPDYNGSSNGNAAPAQGSGSTQYYDNTYSYMQGVPSYSSATYYGPGVSTYIPYSAYTSLSYGGGYGWGGGACGFSPYAYGGYDPFYSSFYSPYGYGYSPYYGYGSGLSISFGFGRPYGYGGYGYSGFGGFYSPYYYNSPFYGGYYGRGGYYGQNYYGSGYGGYGGYGSSYGYGDNGSRSNRTYGHRNDRASDGRYTTGGSTTGTTPTGPIGGGRVRTGNVMAPGSGTTQPPAQSEVLAPGAGGRVRENMATAMPNQPSNQNSDAMTGNRPRRMDADTRPQYRDMNPASIGATQPDATYPNRGEGRTRNMGDAASQSDQIQQQQQYNTRSESRQRGGFFQNVFSQPNTDRSVDQTRQRGYDQSQRTADQPRQRGYDQSQGSFDQPQRAQRTYEQPQQRSYSQPSYSAPSGGDGGGGGGGGGGHSRGPR